ncbi:MAG: peptidoglycan D,D-transpeptidase FtsI family protein [Panacagrimonas sp.]
MSASDTPFKLHPVAPWRRWLVLGFLSLGAISVSGRAFDLQVLQRDDLAAKGERRQIAEVKLPGHRGAIRDRRGEPLALSAPVDSLWCVPSDLLESPEHLAAIAKLVGQKPAQLTAHLTERAGKGKQFVYIERGLAPDLARRVMALDAPGVFSKREYQRFYPAGELSGQIVGFANIDGHGVEGMEAAYDEQLSGTDGTRKVLRDAKRRVIEDLDEAVPAQPGRDLELSIDLRLQYLAYRELKRAVQEHDAKGGLIVVADARNGEVLAVASQPGFNPNNPEDRQPGRMRNRAIVDSFEPGSTVKPLLVAQALEIGALRPTAHIDTGAGWMQVGRLTVRDIHAQGDVDLGLMLAKSSNVGAAKIGLQLGAENVWQGYQRFGLGDRVSTGFPGEAMPLLRPPMQWGQIGTATASYGYGLSLNALHLVRAYSALANDGLMPQLRLVTGSRTQPPQRAVSRETARQVRHMLERVVTDGGTGLRAGIAGYRVAGKTGTVRKVARTGGYEPDKHQSVFIGMVPAENPRLIGLVMIDEPGTGEYYGGVVAAPAFSTVMQAALRLLQIPPDNCGAECGATPDPLPAPAQIAMSPGKPPT